MKTSYFNVRFLVFLCALIPLASIGTAFAQEGYFRVESRKGVWWFIDPRGAPMISVGADHIAYGPDPLKGTGPSQYAEANDHIYPDRNAWGLEALARMRQWGFNTIGSWSDAELWIRQFPYTVVMNVAVRQGANWQSGVVTDFYSPLFAQMAHTVAGEICQPRRFDHNLVGYFSDNELHWGPDWRIKENLLDLYLRMPATAPGHQKAVELLEGKYGHDVAKLNQVWGISATSFDDIKVAGNTDAYRADVDQFLEMTAKQYFEVVERAIHGVDPNHLYLGARLNHHFPEALLRGSRNVDVVSINIYDFDPRPLVHKAFQMTGRPILITEFSFHAQDSGLPNTKGAAPKVANQAARAKAYTDYVTQLESLPEAVGYHWFEWVDQPKEGRFDGENMNYGLIDIHDHPYQELVDTVAKANAAAREAHERAAPE
jgi:agarase